MNYCNSASTDQIGWNGSVASNGLYYFNLGSAQNIEVLSAQLDLFESSASTGSSVSLGLYQSTAPWTNAATYNDYQGSTAWPTSGSYCPTGATCGSGGNYLTTALNTETVSDGEGWYYFYPPTSLIQSWVDGAAGNDYGFEVKDTTDTTNQTFEFGSVNGYEPPYLQINYAQWTGAQKIYTMETHPLTDKMGLGVNVATGNLVLQATDDQVTGVGVPFNLTRTYNDQGGISGMLGNDWTLSAGSDVGVYSFNNGEVVFYGPDGVQVPFAPTTTACPYASSYKEYTAPDWYPATLCTASGGGWTLRYNSSGETYSFSSGGVWTSDKDRNGNGVTYNYTGSSLTSATDSEGRVTDFYYDAVGYLDKIVDSGGRTYLYDVDDTNGTLLSYTDPQTPINGVTHYTYNSDNDLTEIIDPLGNETMIGYNTGAQGDQVSSIIYVTNKAAGTGPTTDFTYNATNTVVTDANSHNTTYYFQPTSTNTEATRMITPTTTTDANGHSQTSS